MHLSKLHSSLIMVAPRRTRRPCWYNILTSALKRYCCSSFTSPMPKIHVQFFLKVWLAFTLCTVIRVTVLLIFKDFWQKINPVAKGKEIAVKFTFANSPHSMPAVDHRYRYIYLLQIEATGRAWHRLIRPTAAWVCLIAKYCSRHLLEVVNIYFKDDSNWNFVHNEPGKLSSTTCFPFKREIVMTDCKKKNVYCVLEWLTQIYIFDITCDVNIPRCWHD